MATANHSAYKNAFSSSPTKSRVGSVFHDRRAAAAQQSVDHYKATLTMALNEHSHTLNKDRDAAKFAHDDKTQKSAQIHERGQAGIQRTYDFAKQESQHAHDIAVSTANHSSAEKISGMTFAHQKAMAKDSRRQESFTLASKQAHEAKQNAAQQGSSEKIASMKYEDAGEARINTAGQAGLGRQHAFALAGLTHKANMEKTASTERIAGGKLNVQRERDGLGREATASYVEHKELQEGNYKTPVPRKPLVKTGPGVPEPGAKAFSSKMKKKGL